MITVYKAHNLQEAYLVHGLLLQSGIRAQVTGEYLSGGIGELPAGDLIRVRVPAAQVAVAQGIIAAYECGAERVAEDELEALALGETQSPTETPVSRRYPGWPLFLAIVALMLLALLIGTR